jgi:hypothetical protein
MTEECFHRRVLEVVRVPIVREDLRMGHRRGQHVTIRQPVDHPPAIFLVLPRSRRLGAQAVDRDDTVLSS